MDELFRQIVGFREQLELLMDILTGKELLAPEDAVKMPLLFKVWQKGKPGAPIHYPVDGTYHRDPFDGNLYICHQEHDCPDDDNYAPSRAHSLWKPATNPAEDGSREHPYSFVQGMELKKYSCYTQYGVLYLCIRPEAFLYADLSTVVGNYVEIVE